MPATGPPHIGARHEHTVGAGDRAEKALLDVLAKRVIRRELSRPWGGWRAARRAIVRSSPGTSPTHYESTRSGGALARSLMASVLGVTTRSVSDSPLTG
jgi:hypothetical protein